MRPAIHHETLSHTILPLHMLPAVKLQGSKVMLRDCERVWDSPSTCFLLHFFLYQTHMSLLLRVVCCDNGVSASLSFSISV